MPGDFKNPLAAAQAAVELVMAIAAFELIFGFPFPYETLQDDVADLKAALHSQMSDF